LIDATYRGPEVSGEEVEKIVAGLFKLEPALITKMGEILK
jgi:hypothetical protein